MRRLILAILLVFVFANIANAATYCVNQSGGLDSNNGSCATPWATVKKAMQTVAPNDFVWIDAGNYNEFVIASNSLQTADDNVTYRGVGMPTIRLANATCNRVIDVINNNNTFDGLVIDMNGTLDTCEFGIYVRNNRNDLVVKNSIIKNGVGATAAPVKIETSGVAGSNRGIVYNNSFINNEYSAVDLTGGNSNNTNISNNYIEVGKTNADYGIFGSSSTGADSYNLTIANNRFVWTGNSTIEGYAIFLQRTTFVNSSYNTQIYNNTFGNTTNKWVGNIIRIVRQQQSNFSNNTIWFNDTIGNAAIWYEGNHTNGTFTYNTFCSPTNLCSASGNGFTFADVSYFLVDHNTAYFNIIGDGLWAQGQTKVQQNNNVTNNYLYVYNTSGGAHALGLGSEGSDLKMNNSYVANNILNVTVGTSGIMHGLFVGSTQNSFAINNTLIGGDYGLLSKLNVNVTFDNNSAINISFVGMYDKGSNNTVFKNNYVEVSNFTQFAADNDGTTYAGRTKDITYFNNTVKWNYVSGMAAIPFRRGANSENVTEYNNTFYLPYKSYQYAFQNASTYYNYLNWQNTFSTENSSVFYPNDTITLVSPTNNSYYNGNNWTSLPNITNIGIANATLSIYYTNGSVYVTKQNTSAITNLANNTITPLALNLTNVWFWNTCYYDTNGFVFCGVTNFTVRSDYVAPVVIIRSPLNGSTVYDNSSILLNTTVTDNNQTSTCFYSLNGASNATYDCSNVSIAAVNFAYGLNNLTFYANDSAGTLGSNTTIFTMATAASNAYYVSTTGSDSNSGNSSANAFRTIAKALLVAPPSSTIVVESGVYYENTTLNVTNGTTTLVANPLYNATVTLNTTICTTMFDVRADNFTLNGFILDNSIAPSDSCEEGVYLNETKKNSIIKASSFKNFTMDAIRLGVVGTNAHNNATIFNNTIVNTTNYSISLNTGASNNTNISGNIIYVQNGSYGVGTTTAGSQKAYNLTLVNNTFAFGGTTTQYAQTAVYLSASSVGAGTQLVTIANNSFGNSSMPSFRGGAIQLKGIQDVSIDGNSIWSYATAQHLIYGESVNLRINVTNNNFCDLSTTCLIVDYDLINLESTNNSLIYNNFANVYRLRNGIFVQAAAGSTNNTNITGNVIYLSSPVNGQKLLGIGADSANTSYNVIVKNNQLYSGTDASSLQLMYFGMINNGSVTNNRADGGAYGHVVLSSINMTFIGNQIHDSKTTGLTINNSNFTNYTLNFISNDVNGTQLVLINGSTVNNSAINTSLTYNTLIAHNETNDGRTQTTKIIIIGNSINTTSNFNSIYMLSNSTLGFQNHTTTYNRTTWRSIIGLDLNSSFYFDDRIQCAYTVGDECGLYNYSLVD